MVQNDFQLTKQLKLDIWDMQIVRSMQDTQDTGEEGSIFEL